MNNLYLLLVFMLFIVFVSGFVVGRVTKKSKSYGTLSIDPETNAVSMRFSVPLFDILRKDQIAINVSGEVKDELSREITEAFNRNQKGE